MAGTFNSAKAARASVAPREAIVPNPKAKLRDRVHEVARFKHLSPRTEQSYWDWMRRRCPAVSPARQDARQPCK
jgi:hypothetical protein